MGHIEVTAGIELRAKGLATEVVQPVTSTESVWDGSLPEWLSALGTVGATMVALGFGIIAYWTARRDRQERLTDRREARLAALHAKAAVYGWAEPYLHPYQDGGQAWIKNQTDLPIQGANIIVYSKPFLGRKGFHLNTSALLPPHETIVIDLEPEHFDPELANPHLYVAITFTDADGYLWTRHPSGALTSLPWPDNKLLEPVGLQEGRPSPEE